MKPLGRKNYGHIGHLPNSRMGPGDHHVHAGQGVICTERVRDQHDRIIVTEKLDGSNVGIFYDGTTIHALGRSGYLAQSSPYPQHQTFAAWVRGQEDRWRSCLQPGQRLVGEWLALAHGTRYDLRHEPFVLFDVMVQDQRLPWEAIRAIGDLGNLTTPAVLSDGPAYSVAAALEALADGGFHGALEPVEGAVWRVERKGTVDFLAKFVRPDKVDGSYLDGPEVWNWQMVCIPVDPGGCP